MIGGYYSVADNNKKISRDSPYSLPICPIFALNFESLAGARPSPFHVPPLNYRHHTRYLFNTSAYLDPHIFSPPYGDIYIHICVIYCVVIYCKQSSLIGLALLCMQKHAL